MQLLLIWLSCVFVSVLLHEMGHVLMAALRVGQLHCAVQLRRPGRGEQRFAPPLARILVSLAGPAVQLLLCLFIWQLLKNWIFLHLPLEILRHPLVRPTFGFLLLINLVWPLFNLLPIWPLDGGQVCRELCEGLMPHRGARVALGISLVLAGLIAVNALLTMKGKILIPVIGPWLPGGMWSIILFGMLALGSWQALQASESGEAVVGRPLGQPGQVREGSGLPGRERITSRPCRKAAANDR